MKQVLFLFCFLFPALPGAMAQVTPGRGNAILSSGIRNPMPLLQLLQANAAQRSTLLIDPSTCRDSSGNRLIAFDNQLIYLISTTHCRDDGVLIAGTVTDTTAVRYLQVFNAFLMKTDKEGNVLWLRFFGDGAHYDYSNTQFNLISELQSGDIVVAGQCFNSAAAQIGSELLARYDAAGTLKWYRTYSSLISTSPQLSPVDFRSVSDGKNGDLIVCGTVMNNSGANLSFTTIRMSGDGNVLWDVNYHHPGGYGLGSEGLGAKLVNGNIVTVGLDHGLSKNNIPAAVEFLTLNYSNGSLAGRRLFATDYSDSVSFTAKQFTYYYNHVAFQDNGHMIVYGSLNSDLTRKTRLIDHFGVMDFDAGTNLVQAYSISSYIQNNSPAATMHFDSKGTGILMLVGYLPGDITQTYLGVLKKGQLTSQRYKLYSGANISNSGGFGENARTYVFDDGSFGLAENYAETIAGSKSYIEFRKMHQSDMTSPCLGLDTLFAQIQPLRVKERAYAPDYVNEVFLNQMTLKTFTLVSQPAPGFSVMDECKQTAYCDTLKIHGDSVFCSGSGPEVFTAFKNAACGAIVQWQLDSSYIASDSILSDSSISIIFKHKNGITGIRATLPAGSCTPGLSDSLFVRVAASSAPPRLGSDTILCGGNAIVLHAGGGFTKYQWQDGSADSVFSAHKPGRYSISVEDGCSNVFKDTIDITDAIISFSLGNDTIKCNSDTLILNATPGFTTYTWTPAYNLTNPDAHTALVFPDLATTYTVKAERGANCIVTDSVRIGVRHSAAVDLGAKEALCEGSSVLLDAGPGFTGYSWNTGQSSESISVKAAGSYVVKATAVNGCISQGVKDITDVYALPRFKLSENGDTTICAGQVLQYHLSFIPASYLWSDGSTGPDKSIGIPGNYSLTVTQDGCPFTSSVQVTFHTLPAVNLGEDAFLCPGQTKWLDAGAPGLTCKWQDGSTGSKFLVSQSGNYRVAVTLDGCTNYDSVQVTYLEKPRIRFPKDTLICQGETVRLNPGLSTQASFTWQDGSTDSVYAVHNGGIYAVTASNVCGSDAGSVTVVPGLCQLLLPNAFTPNGDGKNDAFKIRYSFPVQSYKMSVFNRWGQLVFESADMSKGWDGKLAQLNQPEGGYTWSVEIVSREGEHRSATGVVLLLR